MLSQWLKEVYAMANIRPRTDGKLYFDFQYKGYRCREYTQLRDTVANRNKKNNI